MNDIPDRAFDKMPMEGDPDPTRTRIRDAIVNHRPLELDMLLQKRKLKPNEFLIEAIDSNNETLDVVLEAGHIDITKWCVDTGNPLIHALRKMLRISVKCLVKYLMNCYEQNRGDVKRVFEDEMGNGGTCLSYAIRHNHKELVEAMISCGVEITYRALEESISYELPILLDKLLERRPTSTMECTYLLHVTVWEGSYETCEYLMNLGADPLYYRDGYSAMAKAILLKRKDIIRLFKKHERYTPRTGIMLFMTSNGLQVYSSVQYAEKLGDLSIAKILRSPRP